ncbi:MAG: hypothetical protein KJ718_04050 [Nanoarchaeota archaeon]|nr:hypothetical protein [Nanoarchaeota archaeon]MBU1051701.1 hypothetical protein [Nanoarchaeota archaeon]MBU1987901.1 hypothetical protein [Nanoarchaeota archaeon]
MNNKQLWTTIVVAVIAAVVASVITVSVMGNAMFSPPNLKITSEVNANACNADGVCEVISLTASEDITVGDAATFKYVSAGAITGNQLFTDDFVINTDGSPDMRLILLNENEDIELHARNGASLTVGEDPYDVGHGAVVVEGGNLLVYGELGATGKLNSQEYVGNSTAYACISLSGEIFRSSTPCV